MRDLDCKKKSWSPSQAILGNPVTGSTKSVQQVNRDMQVCTAAKTPTERTTFVYCLSPSMLQLTNICWSSVDIDISKTFV